MNIINGDDHNTPDNDSLNKSNRDFSDSSDTILSDDSGDEGFFSIDETLEKNTSDKGSVSLTKKEIAIIFIKEEVSTNKYLWLSEQSLKYVKDYNIDLVKLLVEVNNENALNKIDYGLNNNLIRKDICKNNLKYNELFHQCCLISDILGMKYLLMLGVDINCSYVGDASDEHLTNRFKEGFYKVVGNKKVIHIGKTALYYACKYDDVEVLELLIQYNPDWKILHGKQLSPYRKAVLVGSKKIINYIHENKIKDNQSKELVYEIDYKRIQSRILAQLFEFKGDLDLYGHIGDQEGSHYIGFGIHYIFPILIQIEKNNLYEDKEILKKLSNTLQYNYSCYQNMSNNSKDNELTIDNLNKLYNKKYPIIIVGGYLEHTFYLVLTQENFYVCNTGARLGVFTSVSGVVGFQLNDYFKNMEEGERLIIIRQMQKSQFVDKDESREIFIKFKEKYLGKIVLEQKMPSQTIGNCPTASAMASVQCLLTILCEGDTNKSEIIYDKYLKDIKLKVFEDFLNEHKDSDSIHSNWRHFALNALSEYKYYSFYEKLLGVVVNKVILTSSKNFSLIELMLDKKEIKIDYLLNLRDKEQKGFLHHCACSNQGVNFEGTKRVHHYAVKLIMKCMEEINHNNSNTANSFIAPLGSQDINGETPLHLLAKKNELYVIATIFDQYIYKSKACKDSDIFKLLNKKNKDGNSVYDLLFKIKGVEGELKNPSAKWKKSRFFNHLRDYKHEHLNIRDVVAETSKYGSKKNKI